MFAPFKWFTPFSYSLQWHSKMSSLRSRFCLGFMFPRFTSFFISENLSYQIHITFPLCCCLLTSNVYLKKTKWQYLGLRNVVTFPSAINSQCLIQNGLRNYKQWTLVTLQRLVIPWRGLSISDSQWSSLSLDSQEHAVAMLCVYEFIENANAPNRNLIRTSQEPHKNFSMTSMEPLMNLWGSLF